MRKPPTVEPYRELELKLAVMAPGSRGLADAVGRALGAAEKALPRQSLQNVYFDTPDHRLSQIGAALRLRRTSGRGKRGWTQTLKLADSSGRLVDSRREWDHPVATPTIEREGIPADVLATLEHQAPLFEALGPCFATEFRRTRWLIRDGRGGEVEVALDQGSIKAEGRIEPLCELEFELKSGDPSRLTELARIVAPLLATWPAQASKAERGLRLAEGASKAPILAATPRLNDGTTLREAASSILLEAFRQFAGNLWHLRGNDDLELAHQARIGWRRLRTALRLFKDVQKATASPAKDALRPLLTCLGHLRDVEVARFEVLPSIAEQWLGRSSRRRSLYSDAIERLDQARARARAQLRRAMAQPACGLAMLEWALWIDGLAACAASPGEKTVDGDWAGRRLRRLRHRVDAAVRSARTEEDWHEVRLLAKRLRYTCEFLTSLLPSRKARAMRRHAIDLQRQIGVDRDRLMAMQMLVQLGADAAIVAAVQPSAR